MKIAVFNSRKEKLCENKEISWEAFCHKVSQTKRTSETMAQYDSFPKEKQDDIKDVGGFVGGSLKEGRRKKGCVQSRSLITLDMDYGRENILEELDMFFDFTCCIYSTHKHRKENPRYRLTLFPYSNVNENGKYELNDDYPKNSDIFMEELRFTLGSRLNFVNDTISIINEFNYPNKSIYKPSPKKLFKL